MVFAMIRIPGVTGSLRRNTGMLVVTPAVLLSVVASSISGQEATLLSAVDFSIHGLQQGSDAAAARQLFGEPDSTSSMTLNFDPAGHQVIEWLYPGFALEMNEMGLINAITLTGPETSTERGLRVGDPVERISDLYGPPNVATRDLVIYHAPDNAFRVIAVRFRDGMVTEIRLGSVSTLAGE